jgi:hypothetical protein
VTTDRIVVPYGRVRAPGWAKLARGPRPGGVISDEQGRVLVNYLQQDLDWPPDLQPLGPVIGHPSRERPTV